MWEGLLEELVSVWLHRQPGCWADREISVPGGVKIENLTQTQPEPGVQMRFGSQRGWLGTQTPELALHSSWTATGSCSEGNSTPPHGAAPLPSPFKGPGRILPAPHWEHRAANTPPAFGLNILQFKANQLLASIDALQSQSQKLWPERKIPQWIKRKYKEEDTETWISSNKIMFYKTCTAASIRWNVCSRKVERLSLRSSTGTEPLCWLIAFEHLITVCNPVNLQVFWHN